MLKIHKKQYMKWTNFFQDNKLQTKFKSFKLIPHVNSISWPVELCAEILEYKILTRVAQLLCEN